jgi:restriction system protein
MGPNQTDVTETPAWLTRTGRNGERELFALEQGLVPGGFGDTPDLTAATTREEVATLVRQGEPNVTEGAINNFTGQLWALRSRIHVGDLVVLPMKAAPQIAIGEITGGYHYRDDPDPNKRHMLSVTWLRTDIPRTAFHQDLLYSLGAFMTVCQIRRHDAAWRLRRLAETGQDPGARPGTVADEDATEAGVATETAGLELERAALDRIQTFIAERLAGHGLARLVGAVLTAEGFACEVVDPGPDGGIDIYAGRGPLGLDSPRLIVQVKSSPTPVDAKVVRELHGVLATHGAEQALLVAWGGVNKVARQELKNQFFKVRVWGADDLVAALFRTYGSLDDELRAEIPLKQIWSLVEESG